MPDVLRIDAIRTDGGTQARARMEGPVVYEYAELMQSGVIFPPVVVFQDGDVFWLADGFHRVEAAKLNKDVDILAEIREGTRRDAVLYAAGANAEHGLRRSRLDVRRAVTALLMDAEWRQWSDREIARRCGCSHPTVANIRGMLTETGKITSDNKARKTANGREINTEKIGANQQKKHKFKPGERAKLPDGREGTIADIGDTRVYVMVDGETGLAAYDPAALEYIGWKPPARSSGDVVKHKDGLFCVVVTAHGDALRVSPILRPQPLYWLNSEMFGELTDAEREQAHLQRVAYPILDKLHGDALKGHGWVHGMHLGIRDNLDMLVEEGLVESQAQMNEMGGKGFVYHITKAGCEMLGRQVVEAVPPKPPSDPLQSERLPIRQEEMLIALRDGNEYSRNAATRAALEEKGLIDVVDRAGWVSTVTDAGMRYLGDFPSVESAQPSGHVRPVVSPGAVFNAQESIGWIAAVLNGEIESHEVAEAIEDVKAWLDSLLELWREKQIEALL